MRPQGVWPSEGSVSDEVFAIAQDLGVRWMATDEGVLGRTLGINFGRDGEGRPSHYAAEKLYTVYQFESGSTQMHLIFRDHTISDLIGFVYSGMPPQDAAAHLIHNIQRAAQSVCAKGLDAVVGSFWMAKMPGNITPTPAANSSAASTTPWRTPPGIQAVTVSEAIAQQKNFPRLSTVVPGSWISANFNVWIGAPEDNKSWEYLYNARKFYEESLPKASESQRNLAFEELLIAEGSDWNWWYGRTSLRQ